MESRTDVHVEQCRADIQWCSAIPYSLMDRGCFMLCNENVVVGVAVGRTCVCVTGAVARSVDSAHVMEYLCMF